MVFVSMAQAPAGLQGKPSHGNRKGRDSRLDTSVFLVFDEGDCLHLCKCFSVVAQATPQDFAQAPPNADAKRRSTV